MLKSLVLLLYFNFLFSLLLQGGYGSNLDPAKLVGKFFTSIDRSIHRMIGAPPAPLPTPQTSLNSKDNFSIPPKVASSQSTMAMSSLMPSASVEAISEWAGDGSRKSMHNRSVSEPDFGRCPKQVRILSSCVIEGKRGNVCVLEPIESLFFHLTDIGGGLGAYLI